MLLGLPVPTRYHPIQGGIGTDFGAIEIEFLPPNQSCLLAAFDNLLEETLENDEPVAVADLAQAAVVRHRFIEVIANVPAVSQVDVNCLHQLPFGADAFE